jgi:hypothetical protein
MRSREEATAQNQIFLLLSCCHTILLHCYRRLFCTTCWPHRNNHKPAASRLPACSHTLRSCKPQNLPGRQHAIHLHIHAEALEDLGDYEQVRSLLSPCQGCGSQEEGHEGMQLGIVGAA